MSPHEPHRDIGNDGNDLALQFIQEVLQFDLVTRHAEVETMYSVFHSCTLLSRSIIGRSGHRVIGSAAEQRERLTSVAFSGTKEVSSTGTLNTTLRIESPIPIL